MKIKKRLLVKENIRYLGKDIDTLSQIFYRELFKRNLAIKEVLGGDVIQLNRKFSNMLGVFRNVRYLEKISASIIAMGERHLGYGVKIEHFVMIEAALFSALREYFADDFTPELAEAWHSVYQEVAALMMQAMRDTDNNATHLVSEENKGNTDFGLLEAVNGFKGIYKVHTAFYDVLFADPWLGQFFYGKSKEVLIEKQTQFMVAAFGGENHYQGDTPAFVHMHMFITDEMSDLRQTILKQAILDTGFSLAIAERWLAIDDSFRQSIVKKSVQDCVMKCQGQMPVIAKKP